MTCFLVDAAIQIRSAEQQDKFLNFFLSQTKSAYIIRNIEKEKGRRCY
jgi:HSP90 family molecular chaperone